MNWKEIAREHYKWVLVTVASVALAFYSYSSRNIEYVKDHANETWNSIGFEAVGYEGYMWGFGLGDYGGAKVWYRLNKSPDNGISYSGYLQQWGDEIHVYGPKATDAIKP